MHAHKRMWMATIFFFGQMHYFNLNYMSCYFTQMHTMRVPVNVNDVDVCLAFSLLTQQ